MEAKDVFTYEMFEMAVFAHMDPAFPESYRQQLREEGCLRHRYKSAIATGLMFGWDMTGEKAAERNGRTFAYVCELLYQELPITEKEDAEIHARREAEECENSGT